MFCLKCCIFRIKRVQVCSIQESWIKEIQEKIKHAEFWLRMNNIRLTKSSWQVWLPGLRQHALIAWQLKHRRPPCGVPTMLWHWSLPVRLAAYCPSCIYSSNKELWVNTTNQPFVHRSFYSIARKRGLKSVKQKYVEQHDSRKSQTLVEQKPSPLFSSLFHQASLNMPNIQ